MCLISEGCRMCFDIGGLSTNYIRECPIKYIGGCLINYIGGLSNKSFRRVVQWMLISEIVQ